MADTITEAGKTSGKIEEIKQKTKQNELKPYTDNIWENDEKLDKKLREDTLNRKNMVNAIAQSIMKVDPPFTFGIYGGWGSGKTHFMESVMERLCTSDTDDGYPKPIIVFFEAWRYQRDEHPEIFMLGELREILRKPKGREGKTWIGKKIWTGKRIWRKFRFAFLDKLIANLEVEAEAEAKFGPAKIKVSYRKNTEWQVYLRDEFDKKFHKITKKATAKGLSKGAQKSPRIVFFIDDLDRCTNENVIDMLEKIRLFLWSEHCVFVLGADHLIIKEIMENKEKGVKGKDYLEKIVNFPFYLPLISGISSAKFFDDKIDWSDKDLEERKEAVEEAELAKKKGEGASNNNGHGKEDDLDKTYVIKLFDKASDCAKASPRKMIILANSYKINCHLTKIAIDAYNDDEKKKKNPHKHEYNVRITAVLTALQTLHEDAFSKLCAGRENREDRLRNFFSWEAASLAESKELDAAVEKEAGDPVDSEADSAPQIPQQAMGNSPRRDSIDALFSGIKELEIVRAIWRARPEEKDLVDDIKDIPFSRYVEFLAAQSEAKQDPRERREDDPWEYNTWDFEKYRNYIRKGSAHTIEWINTNITSSVGVMDDRRLVIWGKCQYLWRVLDVQEGKALLLSERITHAKPYDEKRDGKKPTNVWKDCTLNKWLNGEFLNMAFAEDEQEKIGGKPVPNKGNTWYNIEASGDTEEKIFLLSLDEVNDYLDKDEDYKNKRRKKYEKGKDVEDENGYYFSNNHDEWRQATLPDGKTRGWWWLRSPGGDSIYAAVVHNDGSVNVYGYGVDLVNRFGGVRPAFWLDLES